MIPTLTIMGYEEIIGAIITRNLPKLEKEVKQLLEA